MIMGVYCLFVGVLAHAELVKGKANKYIEYEE